MNIIILHGSDDRWHLFDDDAKQAIDYPSLETKQDAEFDRAAYLRDLQASQVA